VTIAGIGISGERDMSGLPAVLIVDDDTIHQTVTGAMVEKMGYPVLAACDGVQASAVFDEHEERIGCIMLDIHMPNMNGIEFLRHLRRMGKEVEVIIVSGYLDDAKRSQLEPLYPWGYLKKPLDFEMLFKKLTDCPGMGIASTGS
jgi:CheY-like chemotaxis protein